MVTTAPPPVVTPSPAPSRQAEEAPVATEPTSPAASAPSPPRDRRRCRVDRRGGGRGRRRRWRRRMWRLDDERHDQPARHARGCHRGDPVARREVDRRSRRVGVGRGGGRIARIDSATNEVVLRTLRDETIGWPRARIRQRVGGDVRRRAPPPRCHDRRGNVAGRGSRDEGRGRRRRRLGHATTTPTPSRASIPRRTRSSTRSA